MMTTRGGEQVGWCKSARSWRGFSFPFLPYSLPDPFWKHWLFFFLHFSALVWARCTVLIDWLVFTLPECFCWCGAVDTTNENVVALLRLSQISTCSCLPLYTYLSIQHEVLTAFAFPHLHWQWARMKGFMGKGLERKKVKGLITFF